MFAGLGQLQQADEVLNQALELAQLMSDEYDQSSLAVEVARIYLEINKEQANQLLEQTLQQYDNLESDTLTTISYLFLELGQEDRAFQVAKASGDEDMLLHLAATDIETGNYGRAFEAVEAITTAAGKARGLTQVAVGYIQSGDEDRGWELITQSLQLARTAKSPYEEYSDEEYKKQALSSITETLIAAKAYKQVLRLAEEIKDTSIQSNLLAELVLNLEEEANWPLLMKVLPQWLQAVQSMPDLEYRGRDLAKIANLYAKLNQYDQALQIVTAIADPASQASAFANLAAVYAECGQQEQVDRETQETLQKILQELKG